MSLPVDLNRIILQYCDKHPCCVQIENSNNAKYTYHKPRDGIDGSHWLDSVQASRNNSSTTTYVRSHPSSSATSHFVSYFVKNPGNVMYKC
jgi:hypothetical protein